MLLSNAQASHRLLSPHLARPMNSLSGAFASSGLAVPMWMSRKTPSVARDDEEKDRCVEKYTAPKFRDLKSPRRSRKRSLPRFLIVPDDASPPCSPLSSPRGPMSPRNAASPRALCSPRWTRTVRHGTAGVTYQTLELLRFHAFTVFTPSIRLSRSYVVRSVPASLLGLTLCLPVSSRVQDLELSLDNAPEMLLIQGFVGPSERLWVPCFYPFDAEQAAGHKERSHAVK